MRRKKTPSSATIVLGLCFLLIANSFGQTTYTEPSGYVKHTFAVGFNLVAVALHNPAVLKGTIDSESGAEITDADGDFVNLLNDPLATYVLEITSDDQLGAVAEVTSWTATTVTLDGAVGAGAAATYCIRPAKTLDSVFGTNLTGTEFDTTTADRVWIAKPGGSYDQYFYSELGNEFRRIDQQFVNRAKPVAVFYPDAMFVEIKATEKNITLFGDVKVTPTVVSANQGFNLARVSSPAGQTLAESKLELFLKQVDGFDSTTGDRVWLPDGSGGWIQYSYFSAFLQWKLTVEPFGADQGATTLPSAILIERLATQTNTAGVFDLPDAFDNY